MDSAGCCLWDSTSLASLWTAHSFQEGFFWGQLPSFFWGRFQRWNIQPQYIFFQNWSSFCHELQPWSPILQIRRWYKISDRGNPTTVQRRSLDQSSWTEQEQLVHYAKVLAEAFLIWSCLPLVSCLPGIAWGIILCSQFRRHHTICSKPVLVAIFQLGSDIASALQLYGQRISLLRYKNSPQAARKIQHSWRGRRDRGVFMTLRETIAMLHGFVFLWLGFEIE